MGGDNFFVSSMFLLLGVLLLGFVVAYVRVYWFGKGLPEEQAAKTPGRKWLDARRKNKSKPEPKAVAGKKKRRR